MRYNIQWSNTGGAWSNLDRSFLRLSSAAKAAATKAASPDSVRNWRVVRKRDLRVMLTAARPYYAEPSLEIGEVVHVISNTETMQYGGTVGKIVDFEKTLPGRCRYVYISCGAGKMLGFPEIFLERATDEHILLYKLHGGT